VINFLRDRGYKILGITKARPKGTRGNEEFFVLASRRGEEIDVYGAVESALEEVVD